MKANFRLFQRVKFIGLPVDCSLYNKTGFIAGKAQQSAELDFYIVWLDISTDTHLAVSITESCLELEPSNNGKSDRYL